MKSHANRTQHTELEQRRQAEKKWADYLNSTLGVLGYPIGLACLTSKTPSTNAAMGLALLLTLLLTGRDFMPKHFPQRAKRERPNGIIEPLSHKDLLRFYMGTLPAIFGYLYLAFIASTHLVEWYCGISTHQCGWVAARYHDYVGPP
jgi:hypothetical protein